MFEERLSSASRLLGPRLEELLPRDGRLAEAMRYAVLGPGKRFRPFLLFETTELLGARRESAVNVAAAIECLHCYSLAHDDLPAMDDDDMRRGKPSVHTKFDEATAILAGDALQTLAFELLANDRDLPAEVRTLLVVGLARAAGWAGMAGGQQLDMEAEHARLPLEKVRTIQRLKTGALIVFSIDAGALIAGANERDRGDLRAYAEKLGIAYDLADQLADSKEDSAAGKSTIVSVLGAEKARELLSRTIEEAVDDLNSFGERAQALREAARFMLRPFS